MLISLPDKSVVSLDCNTLHFDSVDQSSTDSATPEAVEKAPFGIDCAALAEFLSHPKWKFGDCFRRISDHPRYSPKQSVHNFDVKFLTSIYKFDGSYQGGTFSSSTTEWQFLDGGILSHEGCGWGSHSSTIVEGAESLRAVCLFFGIKQPLGIRGEATRRPLSKLLEDMTSVSLQERRGRLWNMPEPLNDKAQQGSEGKG
jgi:hypothetical protein